MAVPHLAKTRPVILMCGGEVMIWACFAAAGSGLCAVTKLTMNFSVCQRILEFSKALSAQQLKLCQNWVMAQGNYPKHRKQKRIKVLQQPKVQTTKLLKCCVGTLKEPCTDECPQSSRNRSNAGPEFFHNNLRD